VCATLTALALISSLVDDLGARTSAGQSTAQWWWVASVLLLLLAAGVLTLPAYIPLERFPSRARLWGVLSEVLLIGGLLVGGLSLRLPGLTDQPYVVHGDEAACGLEALRWLSGGVPSLISVGWYPRRSWTLSRSRSRRGST
jgi:hypothetical protein